MIARANRFKMHALAAGLSLVLIDPGTWASKGDAQDSLLKNRFLTEAPPQWQVYESLSRNVQGVISSTSHPATGKTKRRRFECTHNANSASILTQGVEPETSARLEVMNPKYAFSLSGRTPKKWELDRLDADAAGGFKNLVTGGPPNRSVLTWIARGLVLEQHRLPEWVNEPQFVLKEVSTAKGERKDLMRVDFDYSPKNIMDSWVRGGWMLLDPSRHWVLTEYQVGFDWEVDGKGTVTATYEYQENGRFPIIKRSLTQYKGITQANKPWETRVLLEFDLYEKSLSDSEFTLSAFGLPEPVVAQWFRIPWAFVIVTGTGIALIVAGYVYKRSLRKRAA